MMALKSGWSAVGRKVFSSAIRAAGDPKSMATKFWPSNPANRIVAVLQEQAPKTITAGDRLHPSARLLQELRAAPLLPGQEAITRPLIPLADGTLLINAPSEPSVGLALQAEVPSADRPS